MNSDNTESCYRLTPLTSLDGIPVFSEVDYYVENYQKISSDHLESFQRDGLNPFMDEYHWREIERSTELLLHKYSVPSAKVLDVGVGMGRLLERFPDLDRYGMDISMGYLKVARAKSIKVCMSKIEDMPFEIAYFDICVCTDVLEHVIDLNLAISRIMDVLKPGGVLIVRVPYQEDLSGYLAPGFPYELVHLRSFNQPELVMLFGKIFKHEVLESVLSGWAAGPLRWGRNNRYARGLSFWLHRLLCRFIPSRRDSFSRFFRCPSEINVVIRKTT